jgi:hypothetical protein
MIDLRPAPLQSDSAFRSLGFWLMVAAASAGAVVAMLLWGVHL